jgi:hypothetical protein
MHVCIYDILENPGYPRDRTPLLNLPNAKIVRLHSNRAQTQIRLTFSGRKPIPFRCSKNVETAYVADDYKH